MELLHPPDEGHVERLHRTIAVRTEVASGSMLPPPCMNLCPSAWLQVHCKFVT